jgi:hypothetical protein
MALKLESGVLSVQQQLDPRRTLLHQERDISQAKSNWLVMCGGDNNDRLMTVYTTVLADQC